ncbi:PAS domain S-box protein [soil metagenome]
MIPQRSEFACLRVVLHAAAEGILLVDAHGCVQVFNPTCEQLFGFSAADVIGQPVQMLLPKWSMAWLESTVDNGRCNTLGMRKDGSTFTVELTIGRMERNAEPVFVGVTHEPAVEAPAGQAMHSERIYRQFVEGVTDYAIYMLDLDGNITSWNSGATRIKQFTAQDVMGINFRKFYTDEARARCDPENNLKAAIATGRFEANDWRVRKDGTQFWANVVIEPLKSEDGFLIGFAKVTSDIKERRRARQIIREADERINTVMDTVVDGVILIESNGNIRTFNPACEVLFGYSKEDVIGLNVKMLMPAEYRDEHLENYHRSGLRKIAGAGREVNGQRRDGSTFPMDLAVGETRQDGEKIYVWIIRDLTDRKRTEEQLIQAQKMETIGQLSGGIAHDFNNLLTVIVGNADFLSEQLKARQDLRNLADDIGRAGERGAELTQRLLAFGRRQILKPVEIDCNELLDSMHRLMRRTLREDIAVNLDFQKDLAPIFADRAQLESAIVNLVLNAQDAMPGGGNLTISTANVSLDEGYQHLHPEVTPGDYVLIAMTDNGEGMPEEACERAFEPFYTTKEVGKGSGLGLSMVYGFVKQSNGHVSLYSEAGLGTTVRIYLPADSRAGAPAFGVMEPAPEIHAPGDEVILVVEDDPFVRSYAMMCLRSLGYRVIAAADGNDALKKLGSDAEIDILFTDVVMPGDLNGWELADLAVAQRPNLRVLLTSGYALDTVVRGNRARAGDVVLAKPYRRSELAARLRNVEQRLKPAG